MAQIEPSISQGHCHTLNQDPAHSVMTRGQTLPCAALNAGLASASQAGGDEPTNPSPLMQKAANQ